MYNKNLLKSGNIVKSEEARVIDSNAKVAERLAFLNEILNSQQDSYSYDDDFSTDGFMEGLDAVQVERLLDDQDEFGDQDGLIARNQGFDSAQIEQMINEANEQAEEILNNAQQEANSIIESAQAEAENIMQRAREEGHNEGYNAGYNEGLQIAEEAEQRCALREQELEAIYSNKIDELEPQFIDKLTDIYEQIFRVDLSDKKDLIFYLISDAMRGIEGAKNFLIHVSADDYEYVSEHREELTQGIPASATIEIIEDMTLSMSQCFIEAESGIFDCGLGTELSLLKKELSLLSFKKE